MKRRHCVPTPLVKARATFGGYAVCVNAEMKGPTTFDDVGLEPPRCFIAKLHEGTRGTVAGEAQGRNSGRACTNLAEALQLVPIGADDCQRV